MIEIELSVLDYAEDAAIKLQPLLAQFERKQHIHVFLTAIPWQQGWSEIANMAIYRHGADVSEVGTTWVSSLASMHALRPFTKADLDTLGGPEAFFSPIWQTGILRGDPLNQVWAIPWHAYPIVLYYYQDLLARAGLPNARAAFHTPKSFARALKKLQASGLAHPFGMVTTGFKPAILQDAASWVWSSGGDFLNADGTRTAFTQPQALAGLRDYFSLSPYLYLPTNNTETIADTFMAGQNGVVQNGPWLGIVHRKEDPKFARRLDALPMPGGGYVGGCSLVIWQHSRNNEAAGELLHFLSSQATRVPVVPHAPNLPARKQALIDLTAQDLFLQVYLDTLTNGRTFPATRLWGVVEARLANVFAALWEDIRINPSIDLEECLHRRLDPLAENLDLALNS
jgi:multiple sugar transport system substrate-binding protein